MNFELPEEMKMLKDMAYKFAVSEIKPVSQECDEHEKYLPEIRIRPLKTVWSGRGFRNNTADPAPESWATPSSPKKYPK
ncbi:MAG TPA: hypothetical protein PLV15_06505 [Smithella sp.]|nr:hypothetical protein [Smithella sp.]